MRWKERGMECMNKQIKNYMRYYLRDNKRLLFLVFIILFMMIPFLAFNVSFLSNDVSNDGAFSIMAAASCIGGCALSFLVPIFNMRFLFMKRSCDLYFSLPITRKDLFHMQYFSGILAMLLPLSINYLLGSIVLIISSLLDSGIGLYTSYLLIAILLFYVVLVIFIVVLYSIFTFISTICNNLIDNILIAGCAVVLPFILYYVLQYFISNQIGQVLSGITYNGYNEFYGMNIVLQVLSPLSVLYTALYNIVELFMVETLDFMGVTYLMIYWIVVGCFAYVFAKKYFIARKQEAAEQRTTHILTYPLIIVLVTLSILLMIMTGNMGVVIPTIMAFMAYCCMIFFSKRVIKLKLGNIITFIVIFAVSASFSFAFYKTNGFGRIREFPVVDNIKVAYIDVNDLIYDDDVYLLIDRQIGQKGKIAKVKGYHYEAKNKKDFERFIENQKYASSNRLGDYEPDDSYSMQMQYELKDGRTVARSYNLAATKENKKKLEELLITMIDEGKNVAIDFEEE